MSYKQIIDEVEKESLGNLFSLKKDISFDSSEVSGPSDSGFHCFHLKPHFLFNSLNILSVQISQDPAKAQELVLNLSDLLRASILYQEHDLIELSLELELAQYYSAIEMERFNGRFAIQYNIDNRISATLPAFTIQHLISNAIHHGILPSDGNGNITVSISKHESIVEINICDDGVGMPQKLLLKRNSGLMLLNDKLKEIDGSLKISSPAGKGTKIAICIPDNVRSGRENV